MRFYQAPLSKMTKHMNTCLLCPINSDTCIDFIKSRQDSAIAKVEGKTTEIY